MKTKLSMILRLVPCGIFRYLVAGGPKIDWATNVPLVRRVVAGFATCGGVSASSTRWTYAMRDAQTANGGILRSGVFNAHQKFRLKNGRLRGVL